MALVEPYARHWRRVTLQRRRQRLEARLSPSSWASALPPPRHQQQQQQWGISGPGPSQRLGSLTAVKQLANQAAAKTSFSSPSNGGYRPLPATRVASPSSALPPYGGRQSGSDVSPSTASPWAAMPNATASIGVAAFPGSCSSSPCLAELRRSPPQQPLGWSHGSRASGFGGSEADCWGPSSSVGSVDPSSGEGKPSRYGAAGLTEPVVVAARQQHGVGIGSAQPNFMAGSVAPRQRVRAQPRRPEFMD
jgi:hypothetical protein